MSTETLLLLILIVLALGAIPSWPYSRQWGYGPAGFLGVIAVIFIVWAVATERPLFREGNAGDAIREAGRETKELGRDAAEGIRDLGDDVKDTVKDATN